MKRLFLICFTIVLGVQLHAQNNLVPNGSFEQVFSCPDNNGNLMVAHVQDWNTPNMGSPDYYNYCGSENFQIPPSVIYGFEYPYSGDGFIGMYLFALHQLDQGEYIQVQLTEPIYPGVRYKVGFYVSLAELSRYAISSIGAYFSVEQIQNSGFDVLDVEPQIQNPAGNIIVDTAGWVLVTDTFQSRTGGGEQWLTIGNFNYAADSDTFAFQPPNPDMGNSFFTYYYIDDVFVYAIDSVLSGIDEEEELGFSAYPNPATEILHIKSAREIVRVRVLDMRGRSVYSENIAATTLKLDLKHIQAGVYMMEVTDKKGRSAIQRIIKANKP